MNQKVSIIITTRNSGKTLNRLLKSIKKQSYKRSLEPQGDYKKVEIIVVDNNSSDNTVAIAKQHTRKVYQRGPERSAQRNFGAQQAGGEYLLILDADMELTPKVAEDCVETAISTSHKVLVIPEKTVGKGLIPRIRQFEREMYMGDLSIEVARFFAKKVFTEFGGYDLKLTGPEDYDLPYRISKKYPIGRTKEYILHHEEGLTLSSLLRKKYYYASQGALYAEKHPELIKTQGNLLFRKAYLKHWTKFLKQPLLGISFIGVRVLETIWATAGYISAVGWINFAKTLLNMRKTIV